jgi:hypothetical protein
MLTLLVQLKIILWSKCNLKYYSQGWILINFNHIKYVMMVSVKIIWPTKYSFLIENMSVPLKSCLNQ